MSLVHSPVAVRGPKDISMLWYEAKRASDSLHSAVSAGKELPGEYELVRLESKAAAKRDALDNALRVMLGVSLAELQEVA